MQESLGLGNTRKLPEILQLFESLLCSDAWANKNEYSDVDDPIQRSARSESIKRMMHHCKQRIRNVKKKAKIIDFPFRFPKFREILHLLDDIKQFGAPMNFCAQRPESLLIPAAKQPGRRAQKIHEGSAYEFGAAQRLSHSFLIDVIYSCVWDGEAPEEGLDNSQSTAMLEGIKESTGQATFGFLTRHYIDGEMNHDVKWSTRTNVDKMKISNELSMFVFDTFADNGGGVTICTEYQRDAYTFRCHPCYQSDGPIYDWINIDFGDDGIFPCCWLSALVVLKSPDDPTRETYQLVVQSAIKKTNVSSVLLTEWTWSPEYQFVSEDTIVGPIFVIIIKEDFSKILVARQYDEWASHFT